MNLDIVLRFIFIEIFITNCKTFGKETEKNGLKSQVVIDNKVYTVYKDELKLLKEISMKKGLNSPEYQQKIKNLLQKEKTTYVKNAKTTSTASTKKKAKTTLPSFRFVADPAKQHLVQDVTIEKLNKITEEKIQHHPTEDPNQVENSTVLYNYTTRNIWQAVWSELSAWGNFIERDIAGVTDILYGWYKWLIGLFIHPSPRLLYKNFD